MNGLFSKGLVLEQYKEPALSRDLREFITAGGARLLELPPVQDPSALTPDEIMEYAAQARIVDERDGALLHEKLAAARKSGATLIIADALDDEPYVSSQLNPLFKLSKQAVGGLGYAAKAAGASETQIVVYKNMYDLQLRIPSALYGVKIKRITGKYPVELENRLGGGKTLLVGVCALIHLYRAIHRGQGQTTCFITVAGNCVANPTNLEVSHGITVTQVLERCGLIEDPTRIVVGGSMTGQSIDNPDETEIGTCTRAVLAFRMDAREKHYHCIGCGRCVKDCPQDLMPTYLYKASKRRNIRILRMFDVGSCIGCGICSYVCPAKLDLTAEILRAGRMIKALDERAVSRSDEEAVI